MSISKDIRLLCTEQDRTALQGILEQLRAKGIRISDADGSTGKKDTVLAVLSEAFYADREKTDRVIVLLFVNNAVRRHRLRNTSGKSPHKRSRDNEQ